MIYLSKEFNIAYGLLLSVCFWAWVDGNIRYLIPFLIFGTIIYFTLWAIVAIGVKLHKKNNHLKHKKQ